MDIVVTGFMGTGKTAVGKRVAKRLGWSFTDLDEWIERSAKKSIARIFVEHGETVFRRMEKRAIARFDQTHGQVIATGGGAFVDPENRRLLKALGPVINLTASPKVVLKRVGRSLGRRPLLSGPPAPAGSSALMRIQQLMQQRAGAYAKADLSVDTSGLSVDQVVDRLWELLSPWMSRSWQYLLRHSDRLAERYRGQYVAVLEDRIVAVGPTQLKAYQRIRQSVPATREVGIYYIPLPEESAIAL